MNDLSLLSLYLLFFKKLKNEDHIATFSIIRVCDSGDLLWIKVLNKTKKFNTCAIRHELPLYVMLQSRYFPQTINRLRMNSTKNEIKIST